MQERTDKGIHKDYISMFSHNTTFINEIKDNFKILVNEEL